MAFSDRLSQIQDRISEAAKSVSRSPSEVTLVAVTKTVAIDKIQEAYDLGLRNFGESRLQEALPKIEALPKDIVWHFIGKLQTNKTKRIAELFNVLHTLESSSQIEQIGKASRILDTFIEVNIAKEEKKSGIDSTSLDTLLQQALECPQVQFQGLMTIGPPVSDPEQMRTYFSQLRKLNERAGGRWLSMGMSNDFEVAIQEGATHVRIGSALFGAR